MANTAQSFEDYFVTHREVKEANPNWSERMVDDYIALKNNLLLVSEGSDSIEVRLERLEHLIPISVYLSEDHATTRNEIITCDNTYPITVTLNAAPDDQEIVQVKRNMSKVLVNGNGKLIDGKSTITLNSKYTALTFVYVEAGEYWAIR